MPEAQNTCSHRPLMEGSDKCVRRITIVKVTLADQPCIRLGKLDVEIGAMSRFGTIHLLASISSPSHIKYTSLVYYSTTVIGYTTATCTALGFINHKLATCYYRRYLIFLSYLTCHYTSIVPCINHRKSKKITLLVPLVLPNFLG